MKKRLVGVLLTFALAGGVLAGCGSSAKSDSASDNASSTSETQADESGRTQLIVGFDAEYPPYGYMDEDGEYTGFDLELAQAVCDMEGWELVKQPIDWSSKDGELNSGSIDCIWNGFTMNGKEDDYEWSDAYVNNEQVIVVAKDSGIETLSDLSGKIVGVQAASAALDVLTNEDYQKELGDTFSQLQQFADYNVAFTELTTGSLDAVAIDIGVAKYQIEERGEGKYMILDEKLNSEQYGIGFKLGNTSLRDVVNADLHKLAEDGTVAELAEKYAIEDMICIE
ncbi:transporter substrate-binding domain-containing protein [Eubacterium oxidoreducens]|uniref:Amino acid ABC transporter substrate-binding protein, PAAT family n=1 Tax=Eubacterium oxidoreducens TaxID=1732 RepID=A0A1G6AGW2_EUBOX|nr:transporter substrate-binding domain-containing protein [Eubacterium oxidoreducens]SDB07672.1 amino acid ABC transporter substrate-binding protein, PAAT family [Eubacterium oxidoreducens]